MNLGLKFALAAAIFLLPIAYPHSALSRIGLSVIRRPSGCVARVTTRLATSCTGTRWLALRCRMQLTRSNNDGSSTNYPAHPAAPQAGRRVVGRGGTKSNTTARRSTARRCARFQGTSFCRLCDALSQLFAECSVPCEHLTAEVPIERLIFGIQIAKSGLKLIKFSASSSIQFNKCRASRHCQNDRENHDKRCAVLRHELSFRVRSEVAARVLPSRGSSNLAPWQVSLI